MVNKLWGGRVRGRFEGRFNIGAWRRNSNGSGVFRGARPASPVATQDRALVNQTPSLPDFGHSASIPRAFFIDSAVPALIFRPDRRD